MYLIIFNVWYAIDNILLTLDLLTMAKHKNWHGASRKRLLKKKLKAQKNK